MNSHELATNLKEGKISVCVIGIGRIGLPTALSFANSGLPTIGVDINTELVEKINSGIFPLKDESGYNEIFDTVTNNKTFHATSKIEDAIPKSDVILLSLPTPMDEKNVPDYASLRFVGEQLQRLIEPGTLLIVESTIEPGFIENEFINIVEGKDKRLVSGKNFGIGVCPETANPGEIMNDFNKLPRLVGAIDEKTSSIISKIYHHVFPVELIQMPDCKTANAVKLTTNVFRDINIAFINELAILFEKLGIDIHTVLEAAKSKYNFQAHYPGAGVGGPCLPVNSYQMLNSAKKFDPNLLRIVKAGREINENMPEHVIELTIDGFKEKNQVLENSEILLLGISYKPNVKDIQLSPAEQIVKKLHELKVKVKIYDPYFKSEQIFGIKTEEELEQALNGIDAIILVTAHKEFFSIEPTFLASKMNNPIVIDTRGVFDISAFKKAGLVYRGIGRGGY